MDEKNIYPTEPLKCWNKAKELRLKYYKDYIEAKDKGGLRWSGSAWAMQAIPASLGNDVYSITGEPYGATAAWFADFTSETLAAASQAGVAHDLCGYLRNYWGCIISDKFILPDGTILNEFPKADFLFTSHVCCSHAKWYQRAAELEGRIPLIGIDASVGPYTELEDKEGAVKYVTAQMNDAIEKLEKYTGRKCNDDLLIEAINNECSTLSLWAEICTYNKNIPAPLDEKTMFSLYVFTTLNPHTKEIVDFYKEMRDEVKDRAARGIAAVASEKYRLMTDSQPPWAALQIFRYLEEKYGAPSIGSWYTFGLTGAWEEEADGTLVPLKTPQQRGLQLKTRQEALNAYADFRLQNWGWRTFQSLDERIKISHQIIDQWKIDGLISHLNKGCEGSSIGQMEARLDLLNKGIPVVTIEGNMGDPKEFDLSSATNRIDIFMESLMEKLNR